MYVADFETTTEVISKTSSRVWIWGIKGTLLGEKFKWGISMKTFIDFVFKNKLSNIYFHNLSFDGNFIFKWLLNNDYKFIDSSEDIDIKLNNKEWTWICDHKKNIYMLSIKNDSHLAKFYDSLKIMPASVDKLGKDLGFPKLKMDYDKIYTKKEDVPKKVLDYLERDIDVVIISLINFFEYYDKSMTIASITMKDFKKFYGVNKFVNDFGGKKWDFRKKEFYHKNLLTEKEWRIIAMSYNGGYTNSNPKYKNIKLENIDGKYYDQNSEYPAVMQNNKMPYGNVIYTKPKGVEDKDYITLNIIHIQKAKAKKNNYPGVFKEKSRKMNAKYYTEIYNEERVMWNEEFEFIKKYYDIEYTIYKKLYFKIKYVFKDWVNERQHNKINAKSKSQRNAHKTVMNSLYGKYGQNYKRGVSFIDIDKTPKDKWRKSQLRYGKNKEYIMKTKFLNTGEYNYIPIASYITSKARLVLFEAIFNNIDLWLYSDTDSCIFIDEVYNIKKHPTKLGYWDLEYEFKEIKILRSKTYMMTLKNGDIIRKIAGVSKEGKEKINYDNFYLGSSIENAKKSSKNVDGGKLILDTDFTIKKEE